jgi:beta-aspartyl-peptidase (threonine type)
VTADPAVELSPSPDGTAGPPFILVHGGAGRPRPRDDAYRAGLGAAAEAAYAAFAGGDCVEAVVAAVVAMEDDPAFNAGRGSVLNSRGEVECDAAVMRGSDQDFGSVVAVRGVLNPVRLARAVLDSPQVMLAAQGAVEFAGGHGVATCDPAQMVTQERFEVWSRWVAAGQPPLEDRDGLEGCDTVGAVALDTAGNLAAATSTGGISFAPPGRVGDSPLPGCGFWADLEGAASATGAGEEIARVMLCRLALEPAGTGAGIFSVAGALTVLDRRVGGSAGLVAVLADGRWDARCNTEMMGVAWRGADMSEARVEVVSGLAHD